MLAFDRFDEVQNLLLSAEFLQRIENDAIADAQIEMQRGGYDAFGWNGEEWGVGAHRMQRIAVGGQSVRFLRQMEAALHNTDRARIKRARSFVRKNGADKQPVSIQ